jgi:outer membrane immunogenic protein
MIKRLILVLAIGAGLLAAAMVSPSLAADLRSPVYKAPLAPVVAPFSWSGFYVGANAGYAWGKADLSSPVGSFTTDTQHGFLAGVTLGYNLQTGVWVWGIEGDVDYAWIKGNAVNTVGTGCAGGGGCDIKNTFFATARGRIGYAWDRFLPYLTGGAAFGNSKISSPAGTSSTKTNVGWTVGAGLEYAFLGNWSAKAEYLYADLGNGTCDASVCGVSVDYKIKTNIVRAGVNYRF